MSVYKLTCETGIVYYGSTKMTLKERKNKGWYKCACKDFINPVMELLEVVEDLSLLEMREDEYIVNNECINKQRAYTTQQDKKKLDTIWRKKNRNKINLQSKNNRQSIINEKKHHCFICNISFQTEKKHTIHNEGYRHKLKHESYLKYGDEWKTYYLQDNKKRYKEIRSKKKLLP